MNHLCLCSLDENNDYVSIVVVCPSGIVSSMKLKCSKKKFSRFMDGGEDKIKNETSKK